MYTFCTHPSASAQLPFIIICRPRRRRLYRFTHNARRPITPVNMYFTHAILFAIQNNAQLAQMCCKNKHRLRHPTRHSYPRQISSRSGARATSTPSTTTTCFPLVGIVSAFNVSTYCTHPHATSAPTTTTVRRRCRRGSDNDYAPQHAAAVGCARACVCAKMFNKCVRAPVRSLALRDTGGNDGGGLGWMKARVLRCCW